MSDFSRFGGASNEWLEVQKTLPTTTPDISIEKLKAATNQTRETAAAQEFEKFASQLSTRDHRIPTRDGAFVEARTYRSRTIDPASRLPIFLHFHGGGFLFGTRDSEDGTCARLATSVAIIVLNVNYRHTPEFTYPTAWQDAEDAVLWAFAEAEKLLGDPERIFIGGISAGGYLSASLTMQQALRKESKALIKGQILLIPNLIHTDCYDLYRAKMKDHRISSLEENKDAPILSKERIKLFMDLLAVKNPDPQDKVLNPGNATADEVRELPPTFIVVAGLDPLRDEALLYGKLLAENG